MSNKTRKHIWPVSLVMAIGIIGALAAFHCAGGKSLGPPRPRTTGARGHCQRASELLQDDGLLSRWTKTWTKRMTWSR